MFLKMGKAQIRKVYMNHNISKPEKMQTKE